MKTKTLFIQIILPLLFIIAAESSLQAQTVIKEKVILKQKTAIQSYLNSESDDDWGFICGSASNRSGCAGFSYYESGDVNNLYRMEIYSGNAQFGKCTWDGAYLYGDSVVVSGYYMTLVGSYDIVFTGISTGIDTSYIEIKVESITWDQKSVLETKNYRVSILPDNFYVSTMDSLSVIKLGDETSSMIEIFPGSQAREETIPPPELKLNLDIIKGGYLGNIKIPGTNLYGKSLLDVEHENGILAFEFVADGDISEEIDTAVVRVWSSFINMEYPKFQDFTFVVYKHNPIEIIFSQPTMNTWDSTSIVLKKRDNNGELVDFPYYQLFNIKIIDGADYSILYSGAEGWYSNEFSEIPKEDLRLYSFETAKDITPVRIYVETYLNDGGVIISSVNEKSTKAKGSKVTGEANISSWTKWYGYGEISIVRSGARLNVSFAKNPISPGEQTKINIDGIDDWENPITFPPEQTFYLYIWNGDQYGELYSASTGQSGEAVVDAPEEFFFNAADSIDTDTAYAEIFVETEYDAGGGVYRITSDNNRKRIKSSSEIMKIYTELKQNKTKEIEDKSRNKITALAGFQSASEVQLLSGMGELMISGGGDCSDAPQCTELDEAPELLFVRVRDSTICLEANRRGGFEAKTESLFNNFALIPCFNHQDDKWQFKLTEDNKVSLNYSLEICNEYLLKTYQEKLIYEVEDLRGKILNDSISVCNAYADILWHKVYGAVHAGDFYLVEVLISHENQHLSDFINLAENLYFQKYYDQFLEYRPHCSEAKNITIAKKGAEIAYGHLMENFRQELINNWKEKIGRTKRERLLYEQETLNRLYSIIDKYYRELQKLHPDKKPCDYCNVGCN